MKNISVSKKILLGFGAVILMIVIILTLATVTSVIRNNDLERADTMNSLQQEANMMLEDFLLARVEIRTLFTSIEAEAEYYLAVEYLDAAVARLATMEGYSKQLGGYMADDINKLQAQFAELKRGIDDVAANDESSNAVIAVMVESGTTMASEATALFNEVYRVAKEMGSGDPALGMERLDAAIVPSKSIVDTVNEIRLSVRPLMLTQDTSGIASLYQQLDLLVSQCNTLRGNLTTGDARTMTDEVMQAAANFRKTVEDVEKVINDTDAIIADCRIVFLNLSDLVDVNVLQISQAVTELNDRTISTSTTTTAVMLVVGVIALIFSIIVATVLGRLITVPLSKMQKVMVKAGHTGNLHFSDEERADLNKEAEAKDEIGQSLLAFRVFIERITYMADSLERIANRDLSIDINLLSNEDTMGNALVKMVDNLNDMFFEINRISSQVAASSQEIAMGAQSLAQGSTEQASTVQEVSASVNEINDQMTISNQTATAAARQGNEIANVAAQGSEKMQHMTVSMQEINDASQAIGQVIKVIDDIAFQTNILALNAAVEAARAGSAGKGFAVVADEVRNLASKSADAAKKTAELISANIEKTEVGLGYTQETAESLNAIIVGITETSNSLQSVAEQSEATKSATAQVTLAVDQVAQVVHQNSATSEESAAASEELSSQARVLQELIAQFRLRQGPTGGGNGGGGGGGVLEFPVASKSNGRSDNTIHLGSGKKYDF